MFEERALGVFFDVFNLSVVEHPKPKKCRKDG
jgi:hypothetical protein